MSSRSISDSQTSAHAEHSPVVPHSSQRGAPHMSQYSTWSSEICFPQSIYLAISCLRLRARIPSEARNLGTYFILAAMTEREVQRFKDVTLHPSSKLTTRLPRAYGFVFSPHGILNLFLLDIENLVIIPFDILLLL